MIRELENERELFHRALLNAIAWQNRCVELEEIIEHRALLNAIAWQNRCVELEEIIEMFCLDAEQSIQTPSTPPAFMG